MNAPTSINLDLTRDAPQRQAQDRLEAVARHVSPDGCQLVIAGEPPRAGQRLSFTIAFGGTITGTIRWVLKARAGFVFDRQIDAATIAALADHQARYRSLDLLPITVPSSSE